LHHGLLGPSGPFLLASFQSSRVTVRHEPHDH